LDLKEKEITSRPEYICPSTFLSTILVIQIVSHQCVRIKEVHHL
jgi:hypothetical protein